MTIRITSKQHGFRRAGVAHAATPTDYPDDHFSEAQLLAIAGEPMLKLVYIEEDGKEHVLDAETLQGLAAAESEEDLTDLDDGGRSQADANQGASAAVVEGTLAGVADAAGKVTPLEELPEEEVRALGTEMEIDGADTMPLPELVKTIQAEKVLVPAADDSAQKIAPAPSPAPEQAQPAPAAKPGKKGK